MRFIRHKDLCNRLKTSSNPRIQNRITKKKWRECRKTFRRHVCCVRLKIYGIRLGIRISAPYAWMPLLHTFDFNRALRAGRVKQLVPFEENFQYRMMRFTKKSTTKRNWVLKEPRKRFLRNDCENMGNRKAWDGEKQRKITHMWNLKINKTTLTRIPFYTRSYAVCRIRFREKIGDLMTSANDVVDDSHENVHASFIEWSPYGSSDEKYVNGP